MSPTGARIRQVMPASDASSTHLSHIACSIVVELLPVELHAGAAPRRSASQTAFCAGVARPERDAVEIVQVLDLAVRRERRGDVGDAAQHALAAEARIERIQVRHAVQQRQHVAALPPAIAGAIASIALGRS